MKRKIINWLGLLGPLSLLSYTLAVIFSPVAYPGYNWMTQAGSDLSAQDAPSRLLWQQLSSVYNIASTLLITLVCVYIEDKLPNTLRIGIYLFGFMQWVSAIGYSMFPLTTSGHANTIQDFIHIYIVTFLVVLLSFPSLITIIIGGFKRKTYRSIAIWALLALIFMITGAIGTGIVPEAYFGIPECFSVFAATTFNVILGIYLFNGFNKLAIN